MTYDAYQTSQYAGEPMTLFRFAGGASRLWLYTSESSTVIRGGETFVPEAIRHGDMEQNLADAPKAFEITVPSTSEIAAEFKPFLPASPITIIVYSRHRPDTEYLPIFIGECESAAFSDDGVATISCQPLQYKMERNIPWPCYSATCNWALYSTGCGVNKDSFKVETAITVNTGFEIKSAAFDAMPDGWFNAGFVVRVSTGEVRWVVAHIGDSLTLVSPFPNFQLGEIVQAFAGCDGLESTCVSKFNNLPNFAGFPDVPNKNPYRDSVFGVKPPSGGGGTGFQRVINDAIKGM
jgi:uncharacterized phage protein (TIGR02218 family)